MNRYTITIAGITVTLFSEMELQVNDFFKEFISENDPDYEAVFTKTEVIASHSTVIFRDLGYEVISSSENNSIKNYFEDDNHHRLYAESITDWKAKMITVRYLQNGQKAVDSLNGAFFHLSWEEMLLREDRLLLHACAVATPYGGILFSGPSGIGKSTQGELWCRYGDGVLVNGDRPILFQQNRVWTAFGSPYAGSSNCHKNISVTIRCVVILKQGTTCSIRKMNYSEAFRKIYEGITANTWDPDSVNRACDLIIELLNSIPVFELVCTPTEDSVKLLRDTLDGGECGYE